ncbi:MAG TPA: DNA-binding protein [Thermoanaerobaculia bacterium]|nr:DNA-binding protein [Thermoanaerobaculia bacterium]
MLRPSKTIALTLLILLALPAVAAAAVPIAGARDLPLGTTVTIEGRVTVPSGLFSSASLEDQGFAIQDVTSGIWVRMDENLGLHRNQQVRVTGTLGQSFNILFVDAEPSGVELLPGSPLRIATGEVGNATEGLIITVAGVITDLFDDGSFGVQLSVDDGSGPVAVFVHRSTGIDPFEIPFIALGVRVQVTGFSSRFADEVELQPRFRDDIRPDR